jgi:hypothetical protein
MAENVVVIPVFVVVIISIVIIMIDESMLLAMTVVTLQEPTSVIDSPGGNHNRYISAGALTLGRLDALASSLKCCS